MSKPLILGAGTCVMHAVINHLGTVPGLSDRVDLVLSQATGDGRDPIAPELLQRCTVLIEETAPWRKAGTLTAAERAALAPGAAEISIPSLHFNVLWPLMVEDPRNRPEPDAPYGRIPFGMADRQALRIVQTVADPAARRAAYDALEIGKLVNLGRYHEFESRSFFAREEGCDVRVAAFVMAEFRRRRLFYTHAHPTGELLAFILAQLFAIPALRDLIGLPYDQLLRGAERWGRNSGIFAGEEAPIHPAVARHFALQWWTPEQTYSWLGRKVTFGDWLTFLLSYEPPPVREDIVPAAVPAREEPPPAPGSLPQELPVGRFLAVLPEAGEGRLVLMPASRVMRPHPFVDGPVDPALSPYGGHFADPQEASYTVGETFTAMLRNASVLGHEGLVLHDGKILADTFRNLAHGAGARVLQSLGDGKATLHPNVPAATRRLDGPHFCGFAGMGHDYGHWIFGTLPRLAAFLRRRADVPGLRLILPTIPAGSIQEQALALLGIDRAWIEEIGPAELLVCDELHLTNAFDLWRVAPFGRAAADRLVSAWAASGGVSAGIERLHIPSPHRNVPVDGADLMGAALALRGFRSVAFEGLPLARQIALVRDARCIVTDGGPGAANMFFAPPGCRVLEVFDPRRVQPMYWSAAAVCGHAYGFQVGVPAAEGPGFAIRNDLMGWALDRMLLAPELRPSGPAEAAVHALHA